MSYAPLSVLCLALIGAMTIPHQPERRSASELPCLVVDISPTGIHQTFTICPPNGTATPGA